MKFRALWKPATDADVMAPPPADMMAEMGQLMQTMAARGVRMDSNGLLPTAKAARLRTHAGELSVIDGPFAETKELVASYAFFEAASLAEAIELTKPFMEINQRYGYEGETDIRQIFDPSDIPAEWFQGE